MAIRHWSELENGKGYAIRVTRPRSRVGPSERVLQGTVVGRTPTGVKVREHRTGVVVTLTDQSFREASELGDS